MIEDILKERGERYGAFKDHAMICQDLKTVMRLTPSWRKLSPSQAQALEVIADKIARMLNGDPNYDDNWVDIIGYSQLVLDELQEHEGQTRIDFNTKEFIKEAKDFVKSRHSLKIGDLSTEGGHIYAGSGNWLYPNSIEGMKLLKKYHPNDKRVRPSIKGDIVDILIDHVPVKHVFTGTVWQPLDSNIGRTVFKECMRDKEDNNIKIIDPISGVEHEAGIDISSHEAGDH